MPYIKFPCGWTYESAKAEACYPPLSPGRYYQKSPWSYWMPVSRLEYDAMQVVLGPGERLVKVDG